MNENIYERDDKKSETLYVRVTPRDKEFLFELAEKYHLSMSKIISRCIERLRKDCA